VSRALAHFAASTASQDIYTGRPDQRFKPKGCNFFLAFLPQFVDADAPSKVAAFITLGLVFNGTGAAWNIAVAWVAGTVGRSTGYARAKVWLERAIGVLLLGIGVKLAFAERP